LTVAILLGVLVMASGAVQTRLAGADPAITGYPDSFAVLGDSISRAYDADGSFGEQPANVWATGTNPSVNSILMRLQAVHPSTVAFNNSVSGAKMSNIQPQATSAVSQGADMVLILMGGNDVCTSSEASMTSVVDYTNQFQTAMNTLTLGLPDARIGVLSIPDVYQLWALFHDNSSARFIWSFASICQSLLANPQSTAAPDVQRRANVRQRNMELNTALHDVCAQYVHCRFDNYLGFNTAFVAGDVSTLDYFHPSVAGQTKIAALSWTNGWDFTEMNPPDSDSSSTMISGGVSVSLNATDDIGVSGIEYKIGAGAYQKYNAPFSVLSPASLTWRAVDVNGNSEATHTCWVGGWTWPAGDTDCDGFPDSMPIDPPNAFSSEAGMGTDPTVECAADDTRNNEPGTDAWPVDFDDNQAVNGSDLLTFAPVFGGISPNPPFDARWDLNNDDRIHGSDFLKMAPFFGRHCAP
jgi:lysophospholipase L1-like esterase